MLWMAGSRAGTGRQPGVMNSQAERDHANPWRWSGAPVADLAPAGVARVGMAPVGVAPSRRPPARPRSLVAALALVNSPDAAYRLVLPTLPAPAAFSHLSAVRIWDLPWEWEWAWTRGEPIHVTRSSGTSRIRRRGMIDHEGLERRSVLVRGGLPVTDVGDTWADLAAMPGTSLAQLVVAGDAILWWRTGRPPDFLADVVRRREGTRGMTLLREALPLVRQRSASPRESLVRLGILRAGLPEPELNADVHNEYGEWLAQVDFLWREQRVIGEYDGNDHAKPKRFRRDASRRQALEDLDFKYQQFTADTLFDPRQWEGAVARLRRWLA